MQASKFEFERRFWIIFGIYAVGFSLGNFDHVPFTTAVRHLLTPSLSADTHAALNLQRGTIAVGAFLVFLTAAIRTWGAAYLRTDVVHDTAQHADVLIADGPFRYVRNPLYLANLPMAAGLGVLASRLGWFFLVGASWLFVYRLIFREEATLRETQGESYRAYLRAVPRFWPALTPRVPAGNQSPHWAQAFSGESFVWLFAIAELALAATMNLKVTLGLFIAGFIAHFILGRSRAGKTA